jgi:hypothetical protein
VVVGESSVRRVRLESTPSCRHESFVCFLRLFLWSVPAAPGEGTEAEGKGRAVAAKEPRPPRAPPRGHRNTRRTRLAGGGKKRENAREHNGPGSGVGGRTGADLVCHCVPLTVPLQCALAQPAALSVTRFFSPQRLLARCSAIAELL